MKASEFDSKFDSDVDVIEYLDLSKASRPMHSQRRININCPVWMIELLDREASRLGVSRQSIIKIWLAERLKENNIINCNPQALSESVRSSSGA